METREEALKLLNEWVSSESLKTHCKGVAFCMEAYAEKLEEAKDKFWITGLLHDFDWEKYPDIDLHPKKGCKELEKLGYDKEIVEAILGHNEATEVKRESLLAKTLFAVDEISGLIIALSKVRPGGFDGMSSKSVKKALKKKDFAAAVSREDVEKGIAELGVDKDEHFSLIIKALSGNVKALGLNK